MKISSIVIVIASYLVSSFVFSINLSQILISIFCSKPLTQKLKIMYGGAADYNRINKKINRTIFVNLTILIAIALLVLYFRNTFIIIGVGISFVITFFRVLSSSGMSQNNVIDYVSVYLRDAYGDDAFKESVVRTFSK